MSQGATRSTGQFNATHRVTCSTVISHTLEELGIFLSMIHSPSTFIQRVNSLYVTAQKDLPFSPKPVNNETSGPIQPKNNQFQIRRKRYPSQLLLQPLHLLSLSKNQNLGCSHGIAGWTTGNSFQLAFLNNDNLLVSGENVFYDRGNENENDAFQNWQRNDALL